MPRSSRTPARVLVGQALLLSVSLHTILTALLWWSANRGATREKPEDEAVLDELVAVAPRVPVEIALVRDRRGPLVSHDDRVAMATAVPGDTDRAAAINIAPTHAPNPDRQAGGPAASSGHGVGTPELVITGRRDEETMRAQEADAAEGYQLARIRTAPDRLSPEEVRSTPHPGFTPDLASRSGQGRSRHLPGSRSLGAPGAPHAPAMGGAMGDPLLATAGPSSLGGPKIGVDGDEPTGFQRPFIQKGPAFTDAGRRADAVSDDRDAAMVSSERNPGPIELSRPAAHGSGSEGRGAGDRPAWAPRGQGNEPVPAGLSVAVEGESLEVATRRRVYNQYYADLKRKLDPLWDYPHEDALKFHQGEVLVSVTVRRDGSIKDLRIAKRSGFESFDRNAINAFRRAVTLPPLPAALGSEHRMTIPFSFENPVIR